MTSSQAQHFISHSVQTPRGRGLLQQVFSEFVRVALDKSPERMDRFTLDQVTPAEGAFCPLPRVPVPNQKSARQMQ